jgi:hypothetical protein
MGSLALSSSLGFVANARAQTPSISNLSPSSGLPGSTVLVQGTNFFDIVSVQFNGVETSFDNVPSLGGIFTRVPTNATTGPVTVVTKHGSYTSAESFVVVPFGQPSITWPVYHRWNRRGTIQPRPSASSDAHE